MSIVQSFMEISSLPIVVWLGIRLVRIILNYRLTRKALDTVPSSEVAAILRVHHGRPEALPDATATQ